MGTVAVAGRVEAIPGVNAIRAMGNMEGGRVTRRHSSSNHAGALGVELPAGDEILHRGCVIAGAGA